MTHMHVHTMFSILDGIGKPTEYAKRAKEFGMHSIAMTDHGNVDGAIRFQKACLDEGINPILGCEFYIVENLFSKSTRENCHMNIWAKNQQGWENILNMLTIASTDGFYYKPRIDPQTLLKHLDGICIGSACVATFLRKDWGMKLLDDLCDNMDKNDIYLEVMPSCSDMQVSLNKRLVELSVERDIKLIATGDCHYIYKEQSMAQATMMAINTKQTWNDPKRFHLEEEMYYMRSESEMRRDLAKQGVLTRSQIQQAINNTDEVASKCNQFRLAQVEVFLPRLKYLEENNITDDFYLTKLIEEGFKKKVFDKNLNIDVYRKRLNMEMELIRFKKFERYFLILWEVIDWCSKNNILVGPARGSSAGSLVCYLLNITRVDPIPYNLLFARFINPARIDLPDIDVDFEDRRKDDVRQHLENLYGKNNVAGVSAFGTLKVKNTLQDIARVFDIDRKFIKKVSDSADGSVEDLLNNNYGKVFEDRYPDQANILRHLEGQIRGKTQHACGTVVSRDDLRNGDKAYLQFNKKEKRLVVNWDKNDIEFQGLMKLDVLGLNELTIQSDIMARIYKNHGIKIEQDDIDLNDKLVLRRFRQGKALGTFQSGTEGQIKFAKEMKVDSFWDIVHINGLFRPGPLGSGSAKEYIRRKVNRDETWKDDTPAGLIPIVEYTKGIIIYQEQVMLAVVELANFDWATADKMRKVIAKSQGGEAIEKFRTQFVNGALDKGLLNEKEAESFFDDLISFGSYGFNCCFSGDMKIKRDNTACYSPTIAEMFKTKNDKKWANENGHSSLNYKYNRFGYGKALSLVDDRLKTNDIIDIYYQGNRDTYTITLSDGKSIRVTDNHKFPILINDKLEMITIETGLKSGDKLFVNKGYEKNTKKYNFTNTKTEGRNFNKYKIKSKGFKSGSDNPAYVDGVYSEFKRNKEFIRNKTNYVCEKCGKKAISMEIHHIDGIRQHNDLSNLIGLCPSCHKKEHYNKFNRIRKNEKGLLSGLVTIESIIYYGKEEVYDVEMADPYHTLVVNEIVASNSHSVSYSHLSYWGMWFKTYYPLEFYCSVLTFMKDNGKLDVKYNKRQALINDAFAHGYEIRPPKKGISKAIEWDVKDEIIYAPFVVINGIGEKDALKLGVKEGVLVNKGEKKRLQGFFIKNPVLNTDPSYQKKANEADANKNVAVTREEAIKLKEVTGILFPYIRN